MAKSLASLPSISSASARVKRPCACGCGETTGRTYAPGHDSRLKGLILRVVLGKMTLDEVEEFGGKGTRAATEAGLKNANLRKRWNIPADVKPEVKKTA